MDKLDETIARKIREARLEVPKRNQTIAAELCDLSFVTYQRAEDTGKSLSIETLYKIAKGFNRPIDWFLGDLGVGIPPGVALKVIADALGEMTANTAAVRPSALDQNQRDRDSGDAKPVKPKKPRSIGNPLISNKPKKNKVLDDPIK